jgi:serine phosphatase RsbU (regulator of sigma subunit)/anti-sigma regulatory factor (Ser/Thr protein kinase)
MAVTTPPRSSRWRPSKRQRERRSDDGLGREERLHAPARVEPPPFEDISPQDPLLAYLQAEPEPVDLQRLRLASPAVQALREAGVVLVVPLVAHGEVVGMLNLGPRLSEQEYSTEDKRLLGRLASQAAPALRVAQLVREQEDAVRRRERYEQEMRLVQLIQQHFLPGQLPQVDGWDLDALYRPAREVGGDFYDVVEFEDGRLGLLIADVTDKGVAAGFVMASARSILRAAVQRLVDPGAVLARANTQLYPDMPPSMFVTCLYGVLDPASGRFRFANAGHNLPCVQTATGAAEVRATGMPLGLMPDMAYEEAEATVEPGCALLLYSDALPEAHGPDGRMFGFPALVEAVADAPRSPDLIAEVLGALEGFTSPDWEQEDDVTVVAAWRRPAPRARRVTPVASDGAATTSLPGHRDLDRFSLPADARDEREARRRVVDAISGLELSDDEVQRLGTSAAEAVMNAVEHGNGSHGDLPVEVRVFASDAEVVVEVTDRAVADAPPATVGVPDLDAKLRGEEPPRGWGLFLIRELLDDVRIDRAAGRHTVSLVLRRTGGHHG